MSEIEASEVNGKLASEEPTVEWHRVLAAEELPEGRVTTVAAGHKSVALVHYDGQFSALDNHCPHQGGPLGEGSIENGLLRCPGTASTTARSTASRRASTTRRSPIRSRSATGRCSSACRRTPTSPPSPT